MIHHLNEQEKHCENCGKPLFGRTDKRFCNDGCRNAHNRQKIAGVLTFRNKQEAEIFHILKRNYEILQSCGEIEPDSYIDVEVERLVKAGFNFNFHTSVYVDGHQLWRFCFERGWYPYDPEFCYLCDRPEQVITEDSFKRSGLNFK